MFVDYASWLAFLYYELAFSLSSAAKIARLLRSSNFAISFSLSLIGVPVPRPQKCLQCFLRLFSMSIFSLVVASGWRIRAGLYWGRIKVLNRLMLSLNFALSSSGCS